MFNNSGITWNNYNLILNGWASQSVQSGITLGVAGLKYTTYGQNGHDILNQTHGWIFADEEPDSYVPSPTVSTVSQIFQNQSFTLVYEVNGGLHISPGNYKLECNGVTISETETVTDNTSSTIVFSNVKIPFTGKLQIYVVDAIFDSFYVNVEPAPTPISNICFPEGTPIQTDQGSIPIDKINVDKHTIDGKPIIAITQTITLEDYLVCFDEDALGYNIPKQKTITSRNHLICHKGNMIEAYKFIGRFNGVRKIKYDGEILYNVLMETHELINVNNLLCETLHPENIIAKLYNNCDDELRTNIIITMNDEILNNRELFDMMDELTIDVNEIKNNKIIQNVCPDLLQSNIKVIIKTATNNKKVIKAIKQQLNNRETNKKDLSQKILNKVVTNKKENRIKMYNMIENSALTGKIDNYLRKKKADEEKREEIIKNKAEYFQASKEYEKDLNKDKEEEEIQPKYKTYRNRVSQKNKTYKW